jgi:hypothetical protein
MNQSEGNTSLPPIGSNMGTTAHHGWPQTLLPTHPTKSARAGAIAQRAGATAPGAGGSARRWNQP